MADRPAQRAKPEPSGIDDIPVWTRRAVVLGMCVTAAAALTVGERLVFPSRRMGDPDGGAGNATRGSLAWARALATGPAAALWAQRNEFVWVALEHPREAALRAGLDRLVESAMTATPDAADPILGHIVNAFRGQRDRQRLEALGERLRARSDLPQASRLMTRALAEVGR